MGGVIEAATSGRAKCRACQQKIEKAQLRFGERVPNPYGEGEATFWFHLECGADYRPEAFVETIEATEVEVPERPRLLEIARACLDNPKLTSVGRAERAPSGRARCRQCRELIEKDELRVVIERLEDGMLNPGGFVHARCASERFGQAGLFERIERRAKGLPEADRDALREQLSQTRAPS